LHIEAGAAARSGIVAAPPLVTRLPITLCVNTRNAAKLLAECIESCAGWVSEIVVVDMESEDDTVEVARRLGARVIEIPNAGIVEGGRQVAINACTQPWALVLDADERAPAALEKTLSAFIAEDTMDGVYLPMKNYLFGRHIRHSGYWPDWQLRFFRPGVAHQPQRVHSRVQVEGETVHAPADLRIALVHHNYATVREWIDRNNRYTDFEVDHLLSRGTAPSLIRLLIHPLARLFQRYVVFQGFRDGRNGLAIALLIGFNYVMIELKLWDRARAGTDVKPPA
jgi:glycosyltransferase involved in cell wall biosynthesis